MKVLFISPFRDGTGYTQAGIDYVLAMDSVGIDVVCRPLKLNNTNYIPPKRIQELENKHHDKYDAVIQHALPHFFSFNRNCGKNIGLFAWETSHFRNSSWPSRLNMMDEVWVINEHQKQASLDSGVNKPINVIPHTIDVSKLQQNYHQLEELKRYKNNGEFLFYNIGEAVRRKNIAALIKAFYLEFDRSEPTRLIIKTNDSISDFSLDVKKALKIPLENKEVVITRRLSDEDIMKLHASCDCYVSSSFGEAWEQSCAMAQGLGKTPIAPNHTGFKEYLCNKTGWLVDSRQENCLGVFEGYEDIYTGTEMWGSVDISHLRKCMREAYQNKELRKEKALAGIKRAYDFSYERVGEKIRRILSE